MQSQSYPHWELAVVNDGSTDGTREWLDGLDVRIRVVHREQGLGAASARNVGGALWRDRRHVLARHWYLIGGTESLHQAAPAGRRQSWRSLRHDALRPKTWIALAASLFGQQWNKRVSYWAIRYGKRVGDCPHLRVGDPA